ncbi:solute carrier family 25 member 44-like isoform X2 [Lethenteron reissneri]|uniref:solute carrier family 25 member 44-like isoform X2 n=1 Tax=Lethenteron reissneri TaxID=7753 RepID=UPI002AB7D30A|nr:solute carrier family 25 member 44-like isoform X2 [Lethenteron reissneri]
MNADGRSVRIIEWEDLDKRKFFTLGIVMTLAIRAAVYPASLIRTRLQVQKGKSVYKGTADAFAKIARAEGARGLYRGFLVNALTIVSGQAYVTTYELARLYVSRFSDSNALKSLVAGGCASLVAQSITVPIDIISQHLMIQGKDSGTMGRFHLCATEGSSLPLGRWRIVAAQILRADGPAGFYRGYTASLLTYIPNSAVWWPFYHAYTEQLASVAPEGCPSLALQAVAGPLAALTANTVTNPMDVVRTRIQVEGKSSIVGTVRQLLAEEGAWGFTKGLSARLISSVPTTVVIVVGYETLKKLSLRAELIDSRCL